MQKIEQITGFTFDSMDFSMSRSSSVLTHVRSNNLSMENWNEDEEGEQDIVVPNGSEEIKIGSDEELDDEGDDEFEQYLFEDDDD